jgi:Cytochrome c7 and related cytochrome c
MAQLFKRRANGIANATVIGMPLLFLAVCGGLFAFGRSDYWTRVGEAPAQPVPFSHQHHVEDLGIDCRYCHTSVETSAFAGMPPTETCMTCHSQIWKDAPILQPVRYSFQTGTPLRWTRVHDLPDYVYFNHSIHVNKGIGCASCHGRVDQMPLTKQVQPLYMRWCLDCHRAPEHHLRPRSEVFNMDYRPPADQSAAGRELINQQGVTVEGLSDCYTCHR